MDQENLIYFGDQVKALGDGKLGGYLVRFTTDKDTDLVGDFFTKDTDLGVESGDRLSVYYHHGFDPMIKNRRMGRAEVTVDDVGVWLEATLKLRDEYEQMVYELAKQGKIGWSSQPTPTLVQREMVGVKTHFIKSWPIGEASLTPTPAEWRNVAIPVKSIYNDIEQEPASEPEPETIKEVEMTDEVKAEVKQEPIDYEALIKQAALEAVKLMKEPEVKAGVQVVEDEADREAKGNPFKTFGDFLKSVKYAELAPYSIDKRLLPLRDREETKSALGINEAVPSEGGFLVPQQFSSTLRENMWGTGTVLSQFAADPVEGNNMTINLVDETSRADGSRNGGLLGYWEAEADTMTATKPKFRQADLKLKRVTVLTYASEEQLEDVSYMESWLSRVVPNELRFKVEAALINGLGVASPLGILQSAALIEVARTATSEVDAADIGGMWSRRYLGAQDYVWFANAAVMPQLYQMTVGTAPVYVPPGGFSASPYGSIFGRPVIETEYNPYLGTVGDILLAAPSQYAMIEKAGGIQGASSIHVQFVSWQRAFRFGYRVDGQPYWASAVTAYDGTNTISPFVALAATT